MLFGGLERRHGGSVGVGGHSSKLTVYLREFGIYILEDVVAAAVVCGMCGSYWTTRKCALAFAAVVMSPTDRKLLKVQVASVQQNKGCCRAAE